MKARLLILFFLIIGSLCSGAQDTIPQNNPPDTSAPAPVRRPPVRKPIVISKPDTVVIVPDTLMAKRALISRIANDSTFSDSSLFAYHPYFRFTDPVRLSVTRRQWNGKEAIFYSLVGLLIFFALIKNSFYRYMQDMFKIFFRTTVKPRQIKDQLVQSPLPSFLLNVFYLLSAGMFITLVLQYYQMGNQYGFWWLYLYAVAALVGIYGVKFLTLKLLGWIFQVREAIDAYIFIVFTTNKVIGMAVLPFIIILAFSYGLVNQVSFLLGITIVLALLAYRFFLSYVSIHRQINISLFHFFLYLCAFEIAPLLLINKLLFRFLGETS